MLGVKRGKESKKEKDKSKNWVQTQTRTKDSQWGKLQDGKRRTIPCQAYL